MDCKMAQHMVPQYIQRQLNNRELAEFLEHINQCSVCYEELEIYFTIHFALQKLNEDQDISYNIQKMLEDNLALSKQQVHRRKLFRICRYGVMLLAELLLALVLLGQIQLWQSGSIRDTFVYQMTYGNQNDVSEKTTEPVTQPETAK